MSSSNYGKTAPSTFPPTYLSSLQIGLSHLNETLNPLHFEDTNLTKSENDLEKVLFGMQCLLVGLTKFVNNSKLNQLNQVSMLTHVKENESKLTLLNEVRYSLMDMHSHILYFTSYFIVFY